MTLWLKQSTSATLTFGPFVSTADGYTVQNGLSLTAADIQLSKNGGALAQKNDSTNPASLTYIGLYSVLLNATDTDTLGRLRVAVNKTGAIVVWQDFLVVPANTYDTLISGSANLNANVAAMANNVLTAAAINTGAITNAKFAAGAIDAAALATDAIGAAELAADAVAEIADAIWDEARSGHTTAGTFGQGVASVQGNVTGSTASVTTVSDKTGYSLASTGLDAIATTAPSGVASNFREMMVALFQRFFWKTTLTSTQLKTYAADGSTVLTTQATSDDGATQTIGKAS